MLSNRVMAVFLLVFILTVGIGTLSFVDNLSGAPTSSQRAQVSFTVIAQCGDNSSALNETCDGPDLNGNTCVTLGNTGGTLSCVATCDSLNATLCLNATANVTAAVAAAGTTQVRGGGELLPMTYNADKYNAFDFATTTQGILFIIFKDKKYTFGVDSLEEDYLNFSISSPRRIFGLLLGQSRSIDLDQDGTLDLEFTFTDKLTRRAVFHIRKFSQLPIEGTTKLTPREITSAKLEIPAKVVDYTQYYIDSLILLVILILAIINFGIFKKHVGTKPSKK